MWIHIFGSWLTSDACPCSFQMLRSTIRKTFIQPVRPTRAASSRALAQFVKTEKQGTTGRITINVRCSLSSGAQRCLQRPDLHNAFNEVVIEELTQAFKDVDPQSTRSVVLTGAGAKRGSTAKSWSQIECSRRSIVLCWC